MKKIKAFFQKQKPKVRNGSEEIGHFEAQTLLHSAHDAHHFLFRPQSESDGLLRHGRADQRTGNGPDTLRHRPLLLSYDCRFRDRLPEPQKTENRFGRFGMSDAPHLHRLQNPLPYFIRYGTELKPNPIVITPSKAFILKAKKNSVARRLQFPEPASDRHDAVTANGSGKSTRASKRLTKSISLSLRKRRILRMKKKIIRKKCPRLL